MILKVSIIKFIFELPVWTIMYGIISLVLSATEIWTENTADETVNIKQVQPMLSNYYFYPELFTVASDFCARN